MIAATVETPHPRRVLIVDDHSIVRLGLRRIMENEKDLAVCGEAETAREASYRSLHYHGGYGFMLEYDIQLYFRRARGWPAQFAEPDVAFGLAAARRLSARAAAAPDGKA